MYNKRAAISIHTCSSSTRRTIHQSTLRSFHSLSDFPASIPCLRFVSPYVRRLSQHHQISSSFRTSVIISCMPLPIDAQYILPHQISPITAFPQVQPHLSCVTDISLRSSDTGRKHRKFGYMYPIRSRCLRPRWSRKQRSGKAPEYPRCVLSRSPAQRLT